MSVADVGSLCHRLTSNTVVKENLVEQGWAELKDVFGQAWAKALADECSALERHGLMTPHTFEFSTEDGKRRTFLHEGRSYVDLNTGISHKDVVAVAPLLAEFATSHAVLLANAFKKTFPELELSSDNEGVQVKLQVSCGLYGCAPYHYDTSESAPFRQITLLVYLTKEWHAGWGGELQIQPFLEKSVTHTPFFDTGVVFLADRTLHRSLVPRGHGATAKRWLLTVWLDGGKVNKPSGAQLPPLLQRLLAPGIYKEPYLRALEASFPHGPAYNVVLKAQEDEIRSIEQDAELAEMLQTLREVVDDVNKEDEVLFDRADLYMEEMFHKLEEVEH